jgi:hypothetical protein
MTEDDSRLMLFGREYFPELSIDDDGLHRYNGLSFRKLNL